MRQCVAQGEVENTPQKCRYFWMALRVTAECSYFVLMWRSESAGGNADLAETEILDLENVRLFVAVLNLGLH